MQNKTEKLKGMKMLQYPPNINLPVWDDFSWVGSKDLDRKIVGGLGVGSLGESMVKEMGLGSLNRGVFGVLDRARGKINLSKRGVKQGRSGVLGVWRGEGLG